MSGGNNTILFVGGGTGGHMRPGLVLQNREERLPAHAAEAVARRADDLATVMDVDVVPVHEVIGDRGVRLRIGALDFGDGGIAEDDPEAERVIGAIPLQDEDLVRWIGALHEDREIQPRRTAADDQDPHPNSALASATIFPAMIRCWISVVPS